MPFAEIGSEGELEHRLSWGQKRCQVLIRAFPRCQAEPSNRQLATGSQNGVLVERTVGAGADGIRGSNQLSRGYGDDKRAQEGVLGPWMHPPLGSDSKGSPCR